MAAHSYVEWPNSNLVCCICRNPFTEPTITRTCSHTFCKGCIIQAIGHSPQCPVDRSPLELDDLLPASNIVQNLVEELIVECPHQAEGCKYTCQRQLLASHLMDGCQYTQLECGEDECDETMRKVDAVDHAHICVHRLVECNGCKEKVRFRSLELHNLECPSKDATCPFCNSTMLHSDLVSHNTSCPDYIIPCTHAPNGCRWTGPRHNLPSSHLPACPFEHIKEFFPFNNRRISRLTDENIVLKYKVEVLESVMQTMKRELQVVKTALGPWYRPDGGYSRVPVQAPIEGAVIFSADPQATPANPRRFSLGPDTILTPPMPEQSPDVNILAPYFPPEAEELEPYSRAIQRNPHNRNSYTHTRSTSSLTQQQTSVAPINLSTTLEGSLSSLRESVVALSASVDSLTRRNDIALRNETLRLNDEILTLRANMHGLRMQVHGIMMDRNAQVTGRSSGTSEGRWLPDSRFYNYVAQMPTSTPSITKL